MDAKLWKEKVKKGKNDLFNIYNYFSVCVFIYKMAETVGWWIGQALIKSLATKAAGKAYNWYKSPKSY